MGRGDGCWQGVCTHLGAAQVRLRAGKNGDGERQGLCYKQLKAGEEAGQAGGRSEGGEPGARKGGGSNKLRAQAESPRPRSPAPLAYPSRRACL